MAHKPKPPPQEEESVEGAPLWIISFADMMSLLMAFFVMLSTFSSFGPAEAQKLRKAMMAALAPNYYGGWYPFHPRTGAGPQAIAAGQHEKGSERPTLEETQGKGVLANTKSEDFRTRKVFVIESSRVFWGVGATLSRDGRDFLDALAAFAAKVPGRIVIAENGLGGDPELACNRALRTLTYLASRGISKDRCCIGTQGTLPPQTAGAERTLEIAILDESTYK